MAEKKNKPEIRFKGFTDDWEIHKVGEITDSYSGGTPSVGNTQFYDGDIPFIRSGEINAQSTELFITEKGLKNSSAKFVEKGDILYALYGATSGEVGISQINGAINQAILAIKPKYGYNSYFFAQWLRKEKETIVGTYLQGGQGNLSGSIVKELEISIPIDNEEQTKNGSLFTQLDDLITLHQRKYNKLVTVKKAMLEKMFPQNGENVPEIRFKGFTEAWEERRLKKIATNISDGDWIEANHIFEEGEYRIIQTGNLGLGKYIDKSNNAKYFHQKDFDELKANEIFPGDILISRLAEPAGRTIILPHTGFRMVTAVDVTIIRPDEKNFDSSFLMTIMNNDETLKNVAEDVSGTSHKRISRRHLEEIIIKIPSLTEQSKIGIFFKHHNYLISLQQCELEKLKNIKKACLEKMFV